MKSDPIRLNFYQGTGAYAWQLAEYLQGNQVAESGRYELRRSAPPKLPKHLAGSPERLAAESLVRWSTATRITHNTPQIVGARGIRSSLVVVESTQAFGALRPDTVEALQEGTAAGSLPDIEINGTTHDARTLLVTLHRHGFIETDEIFPAFTPTRYMVEPTCDIVDASGVGLVAINQLNGRMIRLSETSHRIFEQDAFLRDIPDESYARIVAFVEAGMVRLLCGEKDLGLD